jgi:hypothetical protein
MLLITNKFEILNRFNYETQKIKKMADEGKIKDCVQTIPRPILGKVYKWKVAR